MENGNVYISNIKIAKLFGYLDIDWDLKQDVNILGGINGGGKSTILKAVYSVLRFQVLSDRLEEIMASVNIGFDNGYSVLWTKEMIRPAGGKDIEVSGQCYYTFNPEGEEVGSEELKAHLNFNLINTIEHELISQNVADRIGEPGVRTNLDMLIYREIIARNSRTAYVLEKRIEIDDIDANLKEYIETNSLKIGGDVDLNKVLLDIQRFNGMTVVEALGNLQEMSVVEHVYENLIVKSYMLNMLSSFVNPDSRIYNILDQYFSSTRKTSTQTNAFKFRCIPTDTTISYLSLSSGEKQLLLLFLQLFNSAPERTIFLMDEPDLGMHIDWKEKLVKTMQEINPNAQLIITTHSPSMIEGWFDHVVEMNQIAKM